MATGPLLSSMCFQSYIYFSVRFAPVHFATCCMLRRNLPQTHSLVRVQGIVTSLVFDHALRIRLKAETEKDAASATADTASIAGSGQTKGADSPDSTTIADDEEVDDASTTGPSRSATTDTVATASTTATAVAPQPAKSTDSNEKEAEDKTKSKGNDLIGKINNLVTSDLENITDGRDILFLGEFRPVC